MSNSPKTVARRATAGSTERGFGIVEVIIAMVLVSVVVASGAAALASSSSSERTLKSVADRNAMARKAFERLRVDLSARTLCNVGATTNWKASADAAAKLTSAASFKSCALQYNDMRDAQRRLYLIDLTVQPVDKASDGLGVADVDGDLRDQYDVTAKVTIDPASRTASDSGADLRVAGTLDWDTVGGEESKDAAYLTISSCAVERPDRAVIAGVCQVTDVARAKLTPEPAIKLFKVDESTGTASATVAATVTANNLPVAIAPGTYRLQAPATQNGTKLAKMDPSTLRIKGSESYNALATYVTPPSDVQVCTQIINRHPDYPIGDRYKIADYEVKSTNMYYRYQQAPGYKWAKIYMNKDNTWNCDGALKTHHLRDPVQASSPGTLGLYTGGYDIEVQQRVYPVVSPVGLIVRSAKTNATVACDTPVWNNPTAPGAPVTPRALGDAQLDKNSAAAYYGRANLGGNVTKLCLRFEVMPMEFVSCTAAENTASPSSCVFNKCVVTLPGLPQQDNPGCNGANFTTNNCYLAATETKNATCGWGSDGLVGCVAPPLPGQVLPYFFVMGFPKTCREGIAWQSCELAMNGAVHFTDNQGTCWDGAQGGTCVLEAGAYDPDSDPCNGNATINYCELNTPVAGSPTIVMLANPSAPCPAAVPQGGGGSSLPPANPVKQYDTGSLTRPFGTGWNFNRNKATGAWNIAGSSSGQQGGQNEIQFMNSRNINDSTDFVLAWSAGGGVDQNTAAGGRCNQAPDHGGAGDYSMSGSKAWQQDWPNPNPATDKWVLAQLDNDRLDYVNGTIPGPNRLLEQQPAHLCNEVTFSAGWQLVNLFGMWSCLEVYLENRPNQRIRGRMIDFAPGRNNTPILQLSAGAALKLIGAGSSPRIDAAMANHYPGPGDFDVYDYVASTSPSFPGWNGDQLVAPGYVDVGGFRAIVREVDNDPGCQAGGSALPPVPYTKKSRPATWTDSRYNVPSKILNGQMPSLLTFRVNPVYLYVKNYDNPAYAPPPDGTDDPSLGSDKVSL